MKITTYKFTIGALALSLVFSITVSGQTQPTTLDLNQPLERKIKVGEIHNFQFRVKGGEYARVEVEQKNSFVDVVVSLFGPDKNLVIEMNGKNGRLWHQVMSCIAEQDSVYRVEIKSSGTSGWEGDYSIKLAETRAPLPNDRKRIKAEHHLSAGIHLYAQGAEKFSEAAQQYETARALWRQLDDKQLEGITLVNLGWTYYYLAKTALSVDAQERAAKLFRDTKDRIGESKALQWLGVLHYNRLLEYEKALNYFKQAGVLQLGFKDPSIGKTFEDIGLIYTKLKQYDKAVPYYEQALKVHRALNHRKNEASTLHYVGFMFAQAKQYEKADEYYQKALLISREINDLSGEFYTLLFLGSIYLNWDKVEKAKEYYNQALLKKDGATEQRIVGNLYWSLSLLWQKLNNPEQAIFYGKQGVNVYQEIRSNYEESNKRKLQGYLNSKDRLFRRLSNLLASQGRLFEAKQVLDLLKTEEYLELTRSGETVDTVPYNQAESEVIAKIENLVKLERERSELQKLLGIKGELSPEQNNRLAKLSLDIAAANKAFEMSLTALGRAETSAAARVDEIKDGKVLQSALSELSEKTNSGVVALYTVLGTEEETDADGQPIKDKPKSKFGWVIMVTENRYTAYPIDVTNLEKYVFQFRNALSSPAYNPQPVAEKIYQAIFRQTSPKLKKTLEQDLQEYFRDKPDKTLMWSLDGVLRYIPMAALHDGKQYLVENYRQTVFTKESFVWLMNDYENNWKALGLGVSDKRPNFSELPGVKTELETIVREANSPAGILNGSIKLNDNFKKQTFFNLVNAGMFPVVHISSHYSFNSAKPENSYLLAGDGNLTFAEIKAQSNLFKKVDLLTLSACDTGISGNGKEAEGFAYLAQSLGAKSVIASLWKVSDAGTPELMIRFYKLRTQHPEMPKGEAFRQAQLELLGSDMKTRVSSAALKSDLIDLSGTKIDLPLFEKNPKKPYAHPHYWSSFVLIGNWR